MSDLLQDRIAVITGAAGGIGRATAHALAAHGAVVTVADHREPAAAKVAQEIAAGGGHAHHFRTDITVAGDVAALIAGTLERHGRLDILVNNAGITGPVGPLAEMEERTFDEVFAVNVKGVFLGLRHALPVMIERGSGAIVNVASVTAVRASPGLAAYAASKHAVVGLTRTAAAEAGPHGVRVNAVLPGPTATPMVIGRPGGPAVPAAVTDALVAQVPLGRLSDPDEQAQAICFLASSHSSYVNGEALLVDGGMAYNA